LDDAVEVVFDGVFGGDDLDVDGVRGVEGRIERGGFAGAGRAGDEADAVGLVDGVVEERKLFLAHAKALQVQRHDASIQHAHTNRFAEVRRQGRDAQV